MATKYLCKLADLYQDGYPESSGIVCHKFYIDDLLTGADTIELAKLCMQEVLKVLCFDCFPLCKFGSNSPELSAGMDSQMVGTVHNFEDRRQLVS